MLISSLYVTIQLLSGRLPEDESSSEAEEDQIPFEGSNAKEQVVSGFTLKKLNGEAALHIILLHKWWENIGLNGTP